MVQATVKLQRSISASQPALKKKLDMKKIHEEVNFQILNHK